MLQTMTSSQDPNTHNHRLYQTSSILLDTFDDMTKPPYKRRRTESTTNNNNIEPIPIPPPPALRTPQSQCDARTPHHPLPAYPVFSYSANITNDNSHVSSSRLVLDLEPEPEHLPFDDDDDDGVGGGGGGIVLPADWDDSLLAGLVTTFDDNFDSPGYGL